MKTWYWLVPLVVILFSGVFYALTQQDGELETISETEKSQRPLADLEPADLNIEASSHHDPKTTASNESKKVLPKAPKYSGGVGEVYQEDPISEEDAKKLDKYFEKIETEWDSSMKDFILNELGMTQEDYQTYRGLKSGFERDKMEAFETFHEQMQEKHGENYSYSPTEDEEKFSAQINSEYLERMRKLFGDEGYVRYLQLKDRYNEKLKNEQDPKWGFMTMDL